MDRRSRAPPYAPSVAALLVAGASICAEAGTGTLLVSEHTVGLTWLEPLLPLPDGSRLVPRSVYAVIPRVPAVPSNILAYLPATGALSNVTDLPPGERADYLCARTPQLRFDPAVAYGFEPVSAAATAPGLDTQVPGRLRWLETLEPTLCASSPRAYLSGHGFDFGLVAVGHTLSHSFSLFNGGNVDLLVGTLGPARAPFSVTTDSCSGAVLVAGTGCVFGVSYSPTVAGEYVDRLIIRTNDPLRLELPLMLGGGYIGDPIFRFGFE